MASEPHVNEHEERREQGCTVSAERNSRGYTVSAKVWDTDDDAAIDRLHYIMNALDERYPAKSTE